MRFGTQDDPLHGFKNALKANFNFIGAPEGEAFTTGLNFDKTDLNGKLDLIATMKWLSMTGLQEA